MNQNRQRPWREESLHRNHDYAIVSADDIVIAQRLRRKDARYIVDSINALPALLASNKQMALKLAAAEETVRRLRAFLRDNEVKTLRGIRAGIWQEGI